MPRDSSEAVKWLRKGTDQGDPHCRFLLGNLHLKGDGVRKDLYRGIELIRNAARQGIPDAQLGLGEIYGSGEIVWQNNRKGARWLFEAAGSGYEEARAGIEEIFRYDDGSVPAVYDEEVAAMREGRLTPGKFSSRYKQRWPLALHLVIWSSGR